MKIARTFKEGKMFYENDDKTGRWAKVTVTRFSTIPDLITCALGDPGVFTAFTCIDVKKPCHGTELASQWVEFARV